MADGPLVLRVNSINKLPIWMQYRDRIREVNTFETKTSHMSDMAGPFIGGDSI